MGEFWHSLLISRLVIKINKRIFPLTQIFDKKNNALNAIFNFIEEAEKKGESCLVHSVNGKSRSFTVIVAYLMRKYQWSLSKCLQFIDSRKENLQIRLNYLSELEVLEKRIKKAHSLNSNWDISNS
jgi:protein-tyrosine phosphatase